MLGLVWLPTDAYAIDRLGAVIREVRRWLERLSGAALIGLGVRLAFERRVSVSRDTVRWPRLR